MAISYIVSLLMTLYIAEEARPLQCMENATSISEHQTISDHNAVDNGTEGTENTEEFQTVEAHCLNIEVSLPDNPLSAQKYHIYYSKCNSGKEHISSASYFL